MNGEKEEVREMASNMVKSDRLQSDDSSFDESQNVSLIGGLEEIEASFDGAFDGTKISSVFEVNEREDVAFKNAVARSDKRFEMALGLNLLKKEYFDLKPVRLASLQANLIANNIIENVNSVYQSRTGIRR